MPHPDLQQLVHPSRTALVLQEVQNGVVGGTSTFPVLAAAASSVGVIAQAARLAVAARAAGLPVVHTTAENQPAGFGLNRNARLFAAARRNGAENAPGTTSVRPVPEVWENGDVLLPRYHGLSPLTGGPLDSLLRNAGVTTIVVVGVSLNVAIPNLVFDAVNRSYQVVLVTDAVAGVPVEYGLQVIQHSLALLSTLVTTDALVCEWQPAPS